MARPKLDAILKRLDISRADLGATSEACYQSKLNCFQPVPAFRMVANPAVLDQGQEKKGSISDSDPDQAEKKRAARRARRKQEFEQDGVVREEREQDLRERLAEEESEDDSGGSSEEEWSEDSQPVSMSSFISRIDGEDSSSEDGNSKSTSEYEENSGDDNMDSDMSDEGDIDMEDIIVDVEPSIQPIAQPVAQPLVQSIAQPIAQPVPVDEQLLEANSSTVDVSEASQTIQNDSDKDASAASWTTEEIMFLILNYGSAEEFAKKWMMPGASIAELKKVVAVCRASQAT